MYDTTYRQEDNTIIVKCEVIDRLLGCKTHLRRLLWRGTKNKKKGKSCHQNYLTSQAWSKLCRSVQKTNGVEIELTHISIIWASRCYRQCSCSLWDQSCYELSVLTWLLHNTELSSDGLCYSCVCSCSAKLLSDKRWPMVTNWLDNMRTPAPLRLLNTSRHPLSRQSYSQSFVSLLCKQGWCLTESPFIWFLLLCSVPSPRRKDFVSFLLKM